MIAPLQQWRAVSTNSKVLNMVMCIVIAVAFNLNTCQPGSYDDPFLLQYVRHN